MQKSGKNVNKFNSELFDQYMQNRQNEQNEKNMLDTTIPANCCMCSKSPAKLYCSVPGNKWVVWRKIYKTERRRFLCDRCITVFRPDVTLSLETGDKNKIKLIPVTDKTGNLLPHTRRIQMELLPQTFPSSYCGDLNIICQLVTFDILSDCCILKVIPVMGQEYYMDVFMKSHGYVYITLPRNFKMRSFVNHQIVQFQSYWDGNFKRCLIQYDKTQFKIRKDKSVTTN